MKHFLNFSVYEDIDAFSSDPRSRLKGIGCDGLELLTGYGLPPATHSELAKAVHLPYAADWSRAWNGRWIPEMDPEMSRFIMFGTCREEVSDSLVCAMESASHLKPPYGVLHAGNVNLEQVLKRPCGTDDRKILDDFCEMVNSAVSRLPGGHPPFKLAFENLWWPGLRMIEGWEVGYFERKIEFDEWGICLDTGHLLNCLPGIYTEEDAINSLSKVFKGYGQDVIDRICTVHLHLSVSSEYRDSFESRSVDGDTVDEVMYKANDHIGKIDQHLPFTLPGCKELVDMLGPEHVTHEMSGSYSGDLLDDFIIQRSHFPQN